MTFEAVRADVAKTRSLYNAVREDRSNSPQKFADCECSTCQTAGKYWSKWLAQDFRDLLNTWGIDWRHPTEVTPGTEEGWGISSFMADFPAVGSTDPIETWFGDIWVGVMPGYRGPGSFSNDVPMPSDEELFTVCINLRVDSRMQLVSLKDR